MHDGWEGLLGARGETLNREVRTRDGQVLHRDDLTHDVVHDVLSEGWRVTDDESLFGYASGESTVTFTDRRYPMSAPDLSGMEVRLVTLAERLCIAAGIIDDDVFDWCVFDMLVMGGLDDLRVPTALPMLRGLETLDKAVAGQEGLLIVAPDGTVTDPRIRPRRIHQPSDRGAGRDPGRGNEQWEVGDELPIDHVEWTDTAAQLLDGIDTGRSAWCAPRGTAQPVWGVAGAYGAESSVCTAGVHTGLITLDAGGRLYIRRVDAPDGDYSGYDAFAGYEASGITSRSGPAGPAFFFHGTGFEESDEIE